MPQQSSRDVVNRNLKKVISLCYEMLELADHGDKCRHDAGCGVVYGELRDAAYKLRRTAERELFQHKDRKRKSSAKREEISLNSIRS